MPLDQRPAKKAKTVKATKTTSVPKKKNNTEIILALSFPVCVP